MPVTITLTESQVFQALGNVLTALLPNTVEVVRGQVNRTPAPASADYVVMISTGRARLSTNLETWDQTDPAPTFISALMATQATIQCDVHGPNAADNAQVMATLLRSGYACDLFTAQGFPIQPLYVVDPKQMPFADGEQQYEDRWAVDVVLQINPTVRAPQDFANALTIVTLEVEVQLPVDTSGQLNWSDPNQSGLLPAL